jgi:arginine kinase
MRARVARNVKGFNLPPSMNKEERLKFENTMVDVFEKFGLPGKVSQSHTRPQEPHQ